MPNRQVRVQPAQGSESLLRKKTADQVTTKWGKAINLSECFNRPHLRSDFGHAPLGMRPRLRREDAFD